MSEFAGTPDAAQQILRRIATGHATVHDACALARLLPRWVAPEERMPPAWTDVLVALVSDDDDPVPVVDIASYRPGRGWFYADRGDLAVTPRPLAWMTLPEPPAELTAPV
jgi:hypothetical protein